MTGEISIGGAIADTNSGTSGIQVTTEIIGSAKESGFR